MTQAFSVVAKEKILGSMTQDELRERAHRLIPAGAHTYSKADDQFPVNTPAVIVRGNGATVWDSDETDYLDWGMGLRSVVLGHAYPPVVEAVCKQLLLGSNFVRPSPIEADLAESLLEILPGADMVKFAKNGSDVTTAAIRLARAYTGRKLIVMCSDNPFYSFDDWFIGTTASDTGVPGDISRMTLSFEYGNLDALQALFDEHSDKIACVIIEPAATAPCPLQTVCKHCAEHRGVLLSEGVEECPNSVFLTAARDIAHKNGAVLIFDEMITGFRWDLPGAQTLYGVAPDLSCFGKAFGNGFSVAALAGIREIMELGGIQQKEYPKVFLLSATHGGEAHELAAALAVIREMQSKPVIEHIWKVGSALQHGIQVVAQELGLNDCFSVDHYPCSPVLTFWDRDGKRSDEFRTLFAQEMTGRGILIPFIAPSYSHTSDDVARTVDAARGALETCLRAMEDGYDGYLLGPVIKPVFRRFN